ncbi:MAG: aldehyde dehydrogenase [Candidatus Eremiobacteraeota bacterium]|nr:aldehyde dehydrogenase [Candidatus Eremiobacteraeota bacterium]
MQTIENQAVREWARGWMNTTRGGFVDGAWLEGGTPLASINPDHGREQAHFHATTDQQIEQAVEAANRAFATWSGLTRKERAARLRAVGEVVRSHRAELATLESLDTGKTFPEAFEDDLPDSADIFDYYAGWVDKLYGESCPVEEGFVNFTRHEPLGVCAQIIPWNFPLLMACWKLAPALAMGNTVIIKPSEHTCMSLVRLFELLDGVLPAGVLNLVLGDGKVGDALCRHSQVHKVAFTGSTAVGRKILHAAADSNLKPVSLELGGKSPVVIFEDVDLTACLDRCFPAMFSHKGEKCSEPTRFLIHRKLYAAAIEDLVARAEAVVCGDPFDPQTQQGPQCHREHFERVLEYIELGKKEGARLVAGGGRPQLEGFFVRPTIFADVTSEMRIFQEEIFGPVLCLTPFDDEEEAIALANASTYGLAAGVYTRDVSRAHRVANRLEAGMVFVNRYGCYDFASPFGGFKQSGWGKEMAIHSLASYTRLKSIWIAL